MRSEWGGAELLGKGRAVDGTESGAGGKYQGPGGGLTSVCLKQINKSSIEKGRNLWQFCFSLGLDP